MCPVALGLGHVPREDRRHRIGASMAREHSRQQLRQRLEPNASLGHDPIRGQVSLSL
jgi:hypothetical protein